MSKVRSLSFQKTRRLIRSREFDRVKQDGHPVRGKFIVLNVFAVQNSGFSRVGFITSRIVGSAVVRNRVRRRLREIVRKRQRDLRDGFWIVLIARRCAGNASYSALEGEWLRLAKRASILAS
jgi:ribonuclease P protein component